MFKAKVDYNLKAHSVYLRNTIRYRVSRFLVVFAALIYASVAILSLMMALTNNRTNVEYVLFMGLFFTMFIVSVVRLLILNPNKQYKKYSECFKNVVYEVVIDENNISLELDSDNYRKKAVYALSQVTAVQEFMGYYIFSISDADQIMFASKDITSGTAGELKDFLSKKFGKKYSRKERWI